MIVTNSIQKLDVIRQHASAAHRKVEHRINAPALVRLSSDHHVWEFTMNGSESCAVAGDPELAHAIPELFSIPEGGAGIVTSKTA